MRITGDTLEPSLGSNITVPNGMGIAVGGNKIGHIGSDFGAFKGNVVQCKITRYDVRTTVSVGTGINGVEITGLRVSITPKFSNSMILCMFQLHGEIHYNICLNVYKNGDVPTGTYAGFNIESGNVNWSGIATSLYDPDLASTPFQVLYYYHDFPGSTNLINYAPGLKSADGSTTYTAHINKSINNTGSANNETGVSFSMVWEIAQ